MTDMTQSAQDAAAAPAQAAAGQQTVRTPEQVEAEWSAKQAALGRQYAAENKALRDEISALRTAQQTTQEVAAGSTSEAEALKRQLADANKRLQQREQEYTATLRSTKYPHAAEALDPQVLATMDEAKLAGLEARLTPAFPAVGMESSTPPRVSSAPKSMEDKSVEELKADLARMAPAFNAEFTGSE